MALKIKINTREVELEVISLSVYEMRTDSKYIDIVTSCARSGRIVSIYADGPELERIKDRFYNLPMTYGNCTWNGDLATFIGLNFSNLC